MANCGCMSRHTYIDEYLVVAQNDVNVLKNSSNWLLFDLWMISGDLPRLPAIIPFVSYY